MSRLMKVCLLVVAASLLLTGVLCSISRAAAKLSTAPPFSLNDLKGVQYNLTDLTVNGHWAIIYFYDAESRSCREGLVTLWSRVKDYKDAVTLVAISANSTPLVRSFQNTLKISIPFLLDPGGIVSEAYRASSVFPKTVVVGTGGQIVEERVGAVGSVLTVLAAVVDRLMLNRNVEQAQAVLANPEIQAQLKQASPEERDRVRASEGYAQVRAGDYDKARAAFNNIGNQTMRNEGLGATAYAAGKTSEAKQLVSSLLQESPNNTYGHTLQGNLHFKSGDATAALAEYEKAVTGSPTLPWQQAEAHNNLGRTYAKLGQPDAAVNNYDKALSIYPDYIIPLSNKGVVHNRQGEYEKAEKVLKKAVSVNPADTVAKVLLAKNEDDLVFSRDYEKQAWVRQLVRDLVRRYNDQKTHVAKANKESKEIWTSRPLTVSLVPMAVEGGDPERDGDAEIIFQGFAQGLADAGRVKMVERQIIDKLLEELQLGSTELAQEKTRLRLGKILAARMMAVGDVMMTRQGGYFINFRLVDTETSEVVMNRNQQLQGLGHVTSLATSVGRWVAELARERHPLQAKIASVDGAEVIINLGSDIGVALGLRFSAITEGKPIVFEGEVLGRRRQKVGLLEVFQVQPKMSFARIVERSGKLGSGTKVVETVVAAVNAPASGPASGSGGTVLR